MPSFTGGPYPRVRPKRVRGALFALAGAVAFALIATGCGGGGALALDPVASAADRTLDKRTGRFETTFGFGLGEVTASGSFNAAEEALQLSTELPGPTDAPVPIELRMRYPVMWVHGD